MKKLRNFLNSTKINQRRLQILTLVILILSLIFIVFHYTYQPLIQIREVYRNPGSSQIINLNKQVISSSPFSEFEGQLYIRSIENGFVRMKVIATYTAPNYLDTDNALIADVFTLNNKVTHWEIIEVRSLYLNLDKDRNILEKEIEKLALDESISINLKDEKDIIEKNKNILEIAKLEEGKTNISSYDNRYSFKYVESTDGNNIRVSGSNFQPTTENVIYADWHDKTNVIIFVDQIQDGYEIKSFNASSGEEKSLYSLVDKYNLVGFISKNDYLIISTKDKILHLNIQNLNIKVLHQFKQIELTGDEIYIPDLTSEDSTTYKVEIFDPEYEENKRVEVFTGKWDGSEFIQTGNYINE